MTIKEPKTQKCSSRILYRVRPSFPFATAVRTFLTSIYNPLCKDVWHSSACRTIKIFLDNTWYVTIQIYKYRKITPERVSFIRYNCKPKRARKTRWERITRFTRRQRTFRFLTLLISTKSHMRCFRSQPTHHDIEIYRTSFPPLPLFPYFSHFLSCTAFYALLLYRDCATLRIWISRFFKAILSRSKRDHATHGSHDVEYDVCTVRLIELVRERDIELRSHTWRQTDDASDRPGEFRSLCIYST